MASMLVIFFNDFNIDDKVTLVDVRDGAGH